MTPETELLEILEKHNSLITINCVHKVSLGETGNTAPTGRGRTHGGGNVLQGGGPSDITVWFGDVGTFGGNGKEDRRVTQRVPHKYHGETIVADRRREVGDDRGGSSAESDENAVDDDLYGKTTGNCGTVGGVTTDIRSVCRGEGIQGGWMQEGGLVAPRGDRDTTSG